MSEKSYTFLLRAVLSALDPAIANRRSAGQMGVVQLERVLASRARSSHWRITRYLMDITGMSSSDASTMITAWSQSVTGKTGLQILRSATK